jgi:hypothetical protein
MRRPYFNGYSSPFSQSAILSDSSGSGPSQLLEGALSIAAGEASLRQIEMAELLRLAALPCSQAMCRKMTNIEIELKVMR